VRAAEDIGAWVGEKKPASTDALGTGAAPASHVFLLHAATAQVDGCSILPRASEATCCSYSCGIRSSDAALCAGRLHSIRRTAAVLLGSE